MNNVVSRDKRTSIRLRDAQQGFVQGVLLFALAVLVAIIAAFAVANTGGQNSAERESAKVNATVLMKQASDVQDAVGRMVSDGKNLAYLCITSGTSAVAGGGDCTTSNQSPVDLFSNSYGYIDPPSPPASVFEPNVTTGARKWQYSDFLDRTATAGASATAYMEVQQIDKKVCQSLNRVLGIGSTPSAVGNYKELCYDDSGVLKYRKIVASRVDPGQ